MVQCITVFHMKGKEELREKKGVMEKVHKVKINL